MGNLNFNLPESTTFNRRVPKQKFYENCAVSAALKRSFVDEITGLVAQQARGDNVEPRERRGYHGDRGLRDRTRQRAFERRGVAADGSDNSLPSPLCPDVREPRPGVDRLQGSVRHGCEDLPIAANIARDAARARLEKQIAALEKRARAEKQPKKKFELVQ